MIPNGLKAAVALLVAAGCASNSATDRCISVPPPVGPPQPVSVVDSLEPIKAEFNAHADKPRVVLLVSPVCSECVLGAEVVRHSLLDRFTSSGLHAIVVWLPMLPPDNEAAARQSSGIFAEASATQFYDPERLSGWAYEREQFARKWDEVAAALPADHWLREYHDSKPDPAPEWDVYMLYKPGRRWEERTPKPDAFIRHIGRDKEGQSRYWRDSFNAPPSTGDLGDAMERMGADLLGAAQAMKIELLGFPGCPNTPVMRDHLSAALASLGGSLGFDDINQEALASDDLRRGWPTPTVLVDGADLFGMAAPTNPTMSCRMYSGGVPSADSIAARLRAHEYGG